MCGDYDLSLGKKSFFFRKKKAGAYLLYILLCSSCVPSFFRFLLSSTFHFKFSPCVCVFTNYYKSTTVTFIHSRVPRRETRKGKKVLRDMWTHTGRALVGVENYLHAFADMTSHAKNRSTTFVKWLLTWWWFFFYLQLFYFFAWYATTTFYLQQCIMALPDSFHYSQHTFLRIKKYIL